MPYSRERIGEILIRGGLITPEQLDEALARQRAEGGKLGQILVRTLVLTEEDIGRTLAEQKGYPFISLTVYAVDRSAVSMIPERIARRRLVLPVGFDGTSIVLAMADPLDIEAIDDVKLQTGMSVNPVVASPTQIQYAIDKYIASADAVQDILLADDEPVPDEVLTGDEDVPIVRLVNQLIREGVADDASDIHIEPSDKGVRIRYRIDGVLHEVMQLPLSAKAGLISRIKVMADMDIAERRRPQDGRIAVMVDGRAIDFRVATLPTPQGESIVIRILNQDDRVHSLEDLGMSATHLEIVQRFLSRPYGAVLVSGPTGSGKTTSLYAGLLMLNEESRKIITIEDPIEYQIGGITQMAVNPGIGLSFSRLLRTVLRSDPDIVLVGEIRDPETAEIAIRAALTGHLMLSSIHTNDAPSTLTRLVDMEVAPYVTSSALVGVVAQRLARRLCPACKKKVRTSKAQLEAIGFSAEEAATVKPYGPVGCDECFGTGYRGRIGLFEIMEMTDDVRRLFLKQAPSEQLRDAALANGMQTMRRDALDKVAQGVTSIDEIERVVF
ncbi:MAG: Flp pilus assembly complex ATPase component TadA [Coriobacteriia bacterium]|nr:Flp pilus assembly complex ATPase component TadA [Coriobacteriia bacterium]MBN2823117.1 Flp pilus assembly complex ATPase component TadA [Coriobacteriia bacterium]